MIETHLILRWGVYVIFVMSGECSEFSEP